MGFKIVGRPAEQEQSQGGGSWTTVSPGYFEVFKIPVIRGRTFTDRDNAAAPPVVIINEAMAKQYWKTGDPLNDRLAIGRGGMKEFASEPDRQIIGVVADSRDNGLNQEPGPKMFVPQAQIPDLVNALNTRISPMSWVIRTKVSPLSIRGISLGPSRLVSPRSASWSRSGTTYSWSPALRITRAAPGLANSAGLPNVLH